MKPFPVFGVPVSLWVVVPAFYLTWIIVGWLVKKTAFAWLKRLTAHTNTKLDDVLLHAADLPISIMIFVWGGAALVHVLGPDYTGRWSGAVTTASKIATLLALALFADRLLQDVLKLSAQRYDAVKMSQAFGTVIIHVAVFVIGGLMLLGSLGISITPVVASLGLGSLAVALALQPTLENFFSGFQILVDQPIRLGHFIRLESGEEGFVERIGWRSTWIRQLPNNMVIIPNKQLVNARVLNFNYPSTDLAVLVEVGVHYASDLNLVERVTTEVARDVMAKIPGSVPDFQPFVRFHTFGESSINFSVIMRAKEFTDNYLIKHEFIKALSARYAKEKITIPYPVVAVNTSQEAAIFRHSQP